MEKGRNKIGLYLLIGGLLSAFIGVALLIPQIEEVVGTPPPNKNLAELSGGVGWVELKEGMNIAVYGVSSANGKEVTLTGPNGNLIDLEPSSQAMDVYSLENGGGSSWVPLGVWITTENGTHEFQYEGNSTLWVVNLTEMNENRFTTPVTIASLLCNASCCLIPVGTIVMVLSRKKKVQSQQSQVWIQAPDGTMTPAQTSFQQIGHEQHALMGVPTTQEIWENMDENEIINENVKINQIRDPFIGEPKKENVVEIEKDVTNKITVGVTSKITVKDHVENEEVDSLNVELENNENDAWKSWDEG